MTIAQDFFKEVLENYYDQIYDEVITQFVDEKDFLAYRMNEPSNQTELENLKKLSNFHSLGALLSAMTYLEKYTYNFGKEIGLEDELKRRPILHMISGRFLERFNIILPEELSGKLDKTRRLRNSSAHGRSEPTKNEVAKAIDAIEEYEKFLNSLNIKKVKNDVNVYLEKRKKMLTTFSAKNEPSSNF